jgi:hypothetical protein
MQRFVVCASAVVLLGLAGCAAPSPTRADPASGSAAPRVLGIMMMAPNPSGPIVQEVKPKDTDSNGSFRPDAVEDIYRYDCAQGEYEWTAYIGSNPDASSSEKFEGRVVAGSRPAVRIAVGWLFIYGRLPAGQAGHVSAGGTGTAMIVQHEGPSDGGVVRVFFVGKNWYSDEIRVRFNNALKATLTKVGDYAELDAAGNLTTGSIDTNPAYKKKVDDIMKELETVGYHP